jgi:hypothetical protein
LWCALQADNTPGGGSFSAVPHRFPSKYTKYSFGQTVCPSKKSLAAEHIAVLQNAPLFYLKMQ